MLRYRERKIRGIYKAKRGGFVTCRNNTSIDIVPEVD